MSAKDFINIKKSLDEFNASNQKIDNKFFDLIENGVGCFMTLIKKWNEKGILSHMLSTLMQESEQSTLKPNKIKPKKLQEGYSTA